MMGGGGGLPDPIYTTSQEVERRSGGRLGEPLRAHTQAVEDTKTIAGPDVAGIPENIMALITGSREDVGNIITSSIQDVTGDGSDDDDEVVETAERPTRAAGVTGEDISLGGGVRADPAAGRRGKRQLSRPKG